MADTVVVSARVFPETKEKLEGILAGRSLGSFLHEMAEDGHRIDQLRAQAERLEQLVRDRERRVQALSTEIDKHRQTLEEVSILHRAGVTPDCLAKWSRVLEKSGLTIDHLEANLETYGDLAAVCQELEAEKERLSAALNGLKEEQAGLRASIDTVRQSCEEILGTLAASVRSQMEDLVAGAREYVDFRDKVQELRAQLKDELPLAASLQLMIGPPAAAREVPVELALEVLSRVFKWVEATGQNPTCEPPEAVAVQSAFLQWVSLDVRSLLLWTLCALAQLCSREEAEVSLGR